MCGSWRLFAVHHCVDWPRCCCPSPHFAPFLVKVLNHSLAAQPAKSTSPSLPPVRLAIIIVLRRVSTVHRVFKPEDDVARAGCEKNHWVRAGGRG